MSDKTLQQDNKHFIDSLIKEFFEQKDKSNFSWKEKIIFYKELVYMLKWGMDLIHAMEVIFHSSDNEAIKLVAQKLYHYIKQGKTLSYGINRLPEYFDQWDAAIIKTGETTGNLPLVMQALAEEYAYLDDVKQKYIGALIYPCSLIVISIAAVIYLFASVLPWIFNTLMTSNVEMPAVTQFLKNVSDFFVSYWKYLLAGVWVLSLVTFLYSSTEKGKERVYNLLIRLPIVGKMSSSYYLIKWARYFKLMNSSWMDYVETFRLLRDILDIPLYQSMIENILADISLGKPLCEPMQKHDDIIPLNVIALIKVGEETANLEHALWNVIEIYQEELDNSIKNFSKAIEPIILVFVWWIILMIAMGVFGMIFSVMESVWI